MFTRRNAILAATALLPVGLIAAGCSTTTSAVTIASAAIVADNATLEVLAGLPVTATTTTAIQVLTAAKTAAEAVVAAGSSAGASLGQQLYDAVKAALPVIGPLVSVFPFAGLAVGALEAVLPMLAGLLGLTGAAAVVVPVYPGVAVMSPARAVLLYGTKRP